MLIIFDFLGRFFCLSAKRRPSEPLAMKSDASSDVSFDVSDFVVREARATPRTRKSVLVATALQLMGCLHDPANVQQFTRV